jgi:hypothetical protein
VARHAGHKVICVTPRLSFVGVHLFARWLDQQEALEPVVAGLKEAIRAYQGTHPDDDLALWHHRDVTLSHRFAALLLAPLLGIERLSAFDTQEHPMATLIGQSYQSTTLSQFLGQLERIEAGPWLMPILRPAQGGQVVYVDGHMIAFYVAAVVKPLCTFFFFPLFFSLKPYSSGYTHTAQMFSSAHLSRYSRCSYPKRLQGQRRSWTSSDVNIRCALSQGLDGAGGFQWR